MWFTDVIQIMVPINIWNNYKSMMYLDGLIPGMPPHGCLEQAGLVLSRLLVDV